MDEMDLSFHWLFSEISFIPFPDWSSNELLCLKIAYYLPGKKVSAPSISPNLDCPNFPFPQGFPFFPKALYFTFRVYFDQTYAPCLPRVS